MMLKIPRDGDRAGHAALVAALTLVACLLAVPAMAQRAGDYKAQRFDVTVTPSGADIEVVETIVFEFQSGTFRRVWRDIPSARTDGIEIRGTRMDGVATPRGEGEGHVEVTGRNRVKVQWNFAPVGASVHTFEVRYVARGVIYTEGGHDVLRWRALPGEHRYSIDASRIVFATGAADARPFEARNIETIAMAATPPGLVIEAADIRPNGWVIADLRYPARTMVSSPPAWQQRSADAAALAPKWLMGAAAVLGLGLVVVFATRQGYAAPSVTADETTATAPPEPLPAALAAVLVSRGRPSGYQGVATLLDLADRGVLRVRELPRTLGVRTYELSQVPGAHPLEPHEQTAIQLAFGGRAEGTSLGKARGRLARGSKRFVASVNEDLGRRGLIDPARQAVRDRLTGVSIAMLIASALGSIACAALIPRYDGWPFLLPLGLLIAGLVGVILAASTSALSDHGLIESARWRGFKRYLRAMASEKDGRGGAAVEPRWIVYGIALGLASQWSRYLKSHPGAAPPWFSAAADDGAAFAAFVGSSAASAGGGGAAGGGAAGGGGSGAG